MEVCHEGKRSCRRIDCQTSDYKRITYEIIERNKDLNKIVLAGIKTRGVFIAHRIQERLEQLEDLSVPVVELDTKPFRDDVKSGEDTSLVSVDVTDREVILVDDVSFIQAVPSVLLLIILSVMAVLRA